MRRSYSALGAFAASARWVFRGFLCVATRSVSRSSTPPTSMGVFAGRSFLAALAARDTRVWRLACSDGFLLVRHLLLKTKRGALFPNCDTMSSTAYITAYDVDAMVCPTVLLSTIIVRYFRWRRLSADKAQRINGPQQVGVATCDFG